MLSLHDYRCVVALFEERHFHRTAHALGITQPALTARLRRIENTLDARLFERGRSGVEPTAAGLAFVEGARRVLDAADEAATAAHSAQQGYGQTIRIGMTQVAAHHVAARCLAAFRQAHPLARVRLTEGTTAALEAALEQRRLDAAFLHPPLHGSDLSERLLMRSAAALFNAGGDLAGPLIRYPRSEAPVLMGMVTRAAEAERMDAETLVEANTVLGAVVLSQAGYGAFAAPVDYPHPAVAQQRRTTPPTPGLMLETSIAWRTLDRRAIIRSLIDAARQAAPATAGR